MKSRFQKYHCYKSSGIEWLGDIPSHWRTEKIKYMVSSCSGGTPNTDNSDYWDGDIPWVSAKDMKRSRISTTEDTITDLGLKESASRLIPENTVLMVVRSGILKHTIPVAINTVPVAINQDMKALFVKEGLEPEFLYYFVEGMQKTLLPLWAKQGCTVESIDQGFMGNTNLPLPPLLEQRAIAAFLDRETERIDGLIQKRERLIALLQEKRSALISHAVTKGLNLGVELRPSGIDWLGDIPAHWEVKKLKRIFSITCGSTPESGESSYWDGDIAWVTPADLSRLDSKYIPGSIRTISQEGFDSCALTLVVPGSVIIATRAPIGTLGIAATALCHNQGCKSLTATDETGTLFAYYYLLSVNNELNMKGKGTTFLELGTSELGCFEMPFPPPAEQNIIATYLDAETKKIDGLVVKERKIIEKMKEYRSALISATVTGKIDVEGV